MPSSRRIRKLFVSKPTIEGAGVRLRRAFGYAEVPLFDPFLLLDDFRSDQPRHFLKGFPWHPHRGIETITYMLEGTVEHGDSMGNAGTIGAGDTQWMTAGSGIIHQEMPKGDGAGRMGGFQLWANLPAASKMMDPRYRDVKSAQVPVAEAPGGVRVKVICGQLDGTRGPVRDVVIDPEYLDVSMPAETEYIQPTKPGHTVFAYVVEGKACFCDQKDPYQYDVEGENYFDLRRSRLAENGSLLLFEDGDQLTVRTEADSARFLLVAGRPIKEPVAWYGPIVMNTREELQVAFEEYQSGTFIRKRGRG